MIIIIIIINNNSNNNNSNKFIIPWVLDSLCSMIAPDDD